MTSNAPDQARAALVVLVLALSPLSALSQATPASAKVESAEARSERMFSALGGRARWAALTSLVNDSYQHRSEAPNTVRARISMDLRTPRWRVETTAPNLHLIKVWDGVREDGWRLSLAGQLEDLPKAIRDEELLWHRGHVYRTLHRIARRNTSLQLQIKNDRLEVMEGEQRIAWFQLSSNGEPYAFGAMDDDVGSRCGPWTFQHDGLRHPSWVANTTGTWRANLHALATNVTLDDALFVRPKYLSGVPALHGSWAGPGEFQGQAAEMSLTIEPILSGAFTQWQLAISVEQKPLFAGLLHARRDLEGLHGHWRDSSGDVLIVRSELIGDCLHSDWQKGRSSYCLTGTDHLTITDYPEVGETPFARYSLCRK